MPKKHTRHSRIPRPSLDWRPIFMPRDEFDRVLQESFVVDSATMEHAEDLADQMLGGTVTDALEVLMRIGVLLSEESIPPGAELSEQEEAEWLAGEENVPQEIHCEQESVS